MKTKLYSALALISLCAVAAIGAELQPAHKPDPMTAELHDKKGADFEIGYLANMIHHHEGGVKMARLALKQAKHDELRKAAEMMIKQQEEEITKMTAWLKEWHGKTPSDHPEPAESKTKMDGDYAELQKLEGDAFDRSFLSQMSEHHHGAMSMSELVPHRTERNELIHLAGNIATAQKHESEQMKSWRAHWFPEDHK